jgi:hypothetical protein
MIWHFGELGMNLYWTCNNGVVNSDYDNNNPPGDCKLEYKTTRNGLTIGWQFQNVQNL